MSNQMAITADNVTINIDGVLYIRIVDPFKASYGVSDIYYGQCEVLREWPALNGDLCQWASRGNPMRLLTVVSTAVLSPLCAISFSFFLQLWFSLRR